MFDVRVGSPAPATPAFASIPGMGHVVAAHLAYAHPGGELLFYDVSFRVVFRDGGHGAVVGEEEAVYGTGAAEGVQQAPT